MSATTPIFLFSLPRSGSTLLQRMLAAHSRIGSAAEPWVMLPLAYSLRREGVYAEYNHFQAARAIGDFCQELPNGKHDYYESIRRMAESLYDKAAHTDAEYFLDKTPAYCLITKQILEIFPNAKAIFLFRTPGAIAASMMETFNAGQWSLPSWRAYLYNGLAEMVQTYELHRSEYNRVIRVRYEDLVQSPVQECQRISAFLNIDYEECMTSKFSDVKFKGGMGDTTGRHAYKKVDLAPVEKWKKTLGNPLRKRWYRSYLKWIGDSRIETMGYRSEEILDEICKAKMNSYFFMSDCYRMPRASLLDFVEPYMLKDKIRSLRNHQQVLRHY